jgi:uncharacterized protein YyaL (SSP411 family)
MIDAVRKIYQPNLTMTISAPEKSKLASRGVVYEKIDGKPTAYVCCDQTCLPPTNNIQKMMELLK